MIILRQKLYNRHDIEVLKEIHAATNGFRKGLDPNKVKMTARDVYRLNDFTSQLYQYSKGRGKVNWEEFSTLAEHLGLPKTAKYGKHAIEKLYNPELIERAKRIKAHKMGVGKEYEEGEKLAKKLRTLQKKTNRVYAAYWKDKIGYDEFSKTLDEIRKKETNLESKYDKLVVKVDEAVRRHDSKFLRRINERSSAAQDSALEAINKIENTPVSTEGEGLSQKIKHEATKKRYKVNIVEDSDCGHYTKSSPSFGMNPVLKVSFFMCLPFAQEAC